MTNIKIVISGDDSLAASVLNRQLHELGHQVVGSVSDGRAAIELCESLQPDLMIMNINMPQQIDFRVARIMKECNRIPVIMISGPVGEDLIEAAAQAKIGNLLIKPIEKKNLAPAIEVVLKIHADYCKSLEEISQLRRMFG